MRHWICGACLESWEAEERDICPRCKSGEVQLLHEENIHDRKRVSPLADILAVHEGIPVWDGNPPMDTATKKCALSPPVQSLPEDAGIAAYQARGLSVGGSMTPQEIVSAVRGIMDTPELSQEQIEVLALIVLKWERLCADETRLDTLQALLGEGCVVLGGGRSLRIIANDGTVGEAYFLRAAIDRAAAAMQTDRRG